MSEIYAQLYEGNPLSLTEGELDGLVDRLSNLGQPMAQRSLEMIRTRKAKTAKIGGHGALFKIVQRATRGEGDRVLAENVEASLAYLIIDAARYLHLLPPAVRELRSQAPEDAKAKWRRNL